MEALTPRQIVEELDKYIVGQEKAKKAVAIALRNRYRRKKLTPELQEEIIPKNILMMGPTGVGKTEIARRLARLANAPFVKVEATKFTEVGYVGRDVEGMVRDLVETAIRMVKAEKSKEVEVKASQHAEERILDLLYPLPKKQGGTSNPFSNLFGGNAGPDDEQDDDTHDQRFERAKNTREKLAIQLANKELEERVIEIEVEEAGVPVMGVLSGSGMEELGANFQDMFSNLFPKKHKKRKVTVANARKVFIQEETQKLIDMDEVIGEAINRSEQEGIIFIDEIDKIGGKNSSHGGPDVSREGVQRDILPIIEGSTVVTKYGPVKTDHILFIAAGAFHISKPSDLIPELQGRFPIRVELESLSEDDFCHILTKPKNALLKQYKALLETEGIEIEFMESGIREIARVSSNVNAHTENIGARRLHTVLEKLLEDLSFEAGSDQQNVQIDIDYVRSKLNDVVKDQDLSRYIL